MQYRIAATLSLLALFCAQGFGGTITQNSIRSGNDQFNWGQLAGPELGVLGTPLTVASQGGLNAQLTTSSGEIGKDQQGNLWTGNFAPGDNLIYMGQFLPVAPVVITFASPVSGVGAQMGFNGDTNFTENMVVFGTLGQVLGTYATAGLMNSNGDNSAVYIGVLDSVAEIKSVEFFASNGTGPFGQSFAINQVSITRDAPSVPEPTSLVLLGSGLMWIAGMLKARANG